MFDPIRNRYQFRCPTTDESVWVAVSDFRMVRRLRGAHTPAIFRIRFACSCAAEHEALVSHETLDLEPLGTESSAVFVDLTSGRRELVASELGENAVTMLRKGSWPWTFYCWPEAETRPGFPSSVRIVAPAARQHAHTDRVGVLVRCAQCSRLSVNLVTPQHLDVPFFNDEVIQFVDRPLAGETLTVAERFRHELLTGPVRWEEIAS